MHVNRPDLLEKVVLILHDNARPHLGKDVRELLDGYSWEVLPHPPYSPGMSPPDFDLFPKLKSTYVVCVSLRWRTFLLPLPDGSDSSTVLET